MYCSIYRVSRMILFQRLVKQLTLFFPVSESKTIQGSDFQLYSNVFGTKMVWNTETEYLVKQLVTSDRSLLVCWSGSFCWSGDIWFHPEVPTDDERACCTFWEEIKICDIPVVIRYHPYQFEASVFLFHGWWYLTFCCLIPPHSKLFQGHDLRGSLHSERGRSGANSHETWMMTHDPFFGRMQQKLVGKPESSDSGILQREPPFSVIMARLEGLRTCGDSFLRPQKNSPARWTWTGLVEQDGSGKPRDMELCQSSGLPNHSSHFCLSILWQPYAFPNYSNILDRSFLQLVYIRCLDCHDRKFLWVDL